jgi:hypothetical protein
MVMNEKSEDKVGGRKIKTAFSSGVQSEYDWS